MAMGGQARVNIILELRNRLRGGMDRARQYLNRNVRDMRGRLNDLRASHIEAFKAMGDEIPGFRRAMALLGNPYVLVIAGITALVTITKQAMEINRQWREGMAKVNVTAQLTKSEFKELNKEVDTIARRNLTPYADVPQAFNKIISAGLSVEDSLKALEPTLKAAKAGFTDVETVAGAAVSVMNSSGVDDVTKVYDILFATLNKGNAEFKDVANYLPKIIPNARNVGVSLEEVAGAYAYMTAQGQTAEKAATLLENAFKVLADPEKIKNFKKLGIAIYDSKGQMRSLVDISKDLNKSIAGLTDREKTKKLATLGLDTEAASAFAVMSQDAEKLKDAIDFTTASAGQLEMAVENSKTGLEGWTLIGNQIKSVLNDIGDEANTWFGSLADDLLPGVVAEVDRFKEGTGLVYGLWQTISTVVGGVWDILSSLLKTAWKITEPIRLILADLLGTTKQGNILTDIFSVLKWVAEAIHTVVSNIVDAITWVYEHIVKPVIEWFGGGGSDEAVQAAENTREARQAAKEGFENVDDWKDAHNAGKSAAEYYTEQTPARHGGIKFVDDNLYGTARKATNSNTKTTADDDSDKGKSITGSQQVRNITISKLVFVEGNPQFINQKLGNMSPQELERWFTEMMARMMANIGRSYQ